MFSFKGYDLSQRVDPGVGPAGRLQTGSLTKKLIKRSLQDFLDRHAVRLNLVARVVGSIILDQQAQPAHGVRA